MQIPFLTCLLAVCVLNSSFAQETSSKRDSLSYWPQWRGPLGTGVAPNGNPPTEWSEEKNIRWKIGLPGKGHSTPVIWGDKIFITTAVPTGERKEPVYDDAEGSHDNLPVTRTHQFVAMAINRHDGKILWRKMLNEAFPHQGGHFTGSLASASPVVDSEHVFAYFGSYGLYCLDHDGNLIWKKDFGKMQTRHAHGEGSSPALHGNTLVVNWDHEGDSFVVAMNKITGAELWKAERDEITSWATPVIVEHGGKAQVIVSATDRIRGYDLATGEVIWECAGLSRNVIPTPVPGGGMVYVSNSYDWQIMLAIRLDGAKGDITGTDQIAWKLERLIPYVATPLLYDDTLYFTRHIQNVLTGLNAKTGEITHGPYRLDGIREVFSSPVGAANRIYIADRDGTTLVFGHGEEPRPIAMNYLNDSFNASPAIAGNELYLRGEHFLYCIAEH